MNVGGHSNRYPARTRALFCPSDQISDGSLELMLDAVQNGTFPEWIWRGDDATPPAFLGRPERETV